MRWGMRGWGFSDAGGTSEKLNGPWLNCELTLGVREGRLWSSKWA